MPHRRSRSVARSSTSCRRREEYVTQAVAAALGVTERLKQPLEDVLHDRLRRGRTLLVLDNCEHLVDAAAGFVERVLAACPATVVLVTSRERLGVPGERVVPLDPLPVAGEAQELFRQRAARRRPRFRRRPRHRRGDLRAPRRDAARDRARGGAQRVAGRPTGCSPASTTPFGCCRAGAALTGGTARCGPSSTGATGCWTTTSGRCSAASRCSRAASTSRPSSPSWRPASRHRSSPTSWAGSWTRASSCAGTGAGDCSRRCAPSPPSSSAPVTSTRPPGAGT